LKRIVIALLFSIGVAFAVLLLCREQHQALRPRDLPSVASGATNSHGRLSPEIAKELAELEGRERHFSGTLWAKEMLAEECGRTFEAFWDQLKGSTNKLAAVKALHFERIILPQWKPAKNLVHGIQLREPSEAPEKQIKSFDDWQRILDKLGEQGWELEQLEFRHVRFDTDETGRPFESRFAFSAHLKNQLLLDRAALEGDLVARWAMKQADEELTPVQQIDASHLTLKTRRGKTPFELIAEERVNPLRDSHRSDPMLVYDLDADGVPEIIFAARNQVYRRREGKYVRELFCRFPAEFISSAVIADFDGDGNADFLIAKYEGLFLFKGSPGGRFEEKARLVAIPEPLLQQATVMTCGDIDGDGDLDVFVAQYKEPYADGATPKPYFDANDGYPAFLFLNDGNGNFRDATAESGLAKNRLRRSFSASFVDLDNDGKLDLTVVSDFAGLDLYRNDGKGHFTEVTQQWIPDRHAFGMAHAITDFDSDGRLDLLMIGMTSPAVQRLDHLGLWRAGPTDDRTMRRRMTFGNRLYLARPNGGFQQNEFSDSIAHSGSSWGCSAFDFDNDGWPDVYIGNGLESNSSVRDYESECWLHDQFVEGAAAHLYFDSKFSRTRGRDYSYGGYEKNRLFLNQSGKAFLECGYLMGVALEQDSRNVVSTDLDGDGRVDLLVSTLEIWPEAKQRLFIYKNDCEESGNWIGFRFREQKGQSPVGAQVTLHWNGKTAIQQILTGDSYRSEHPPTIHYGLGSATQVQSVEIRWSNGRTVTLESPEVNHYHMIPTTN
jgi:hypothetical protein